MGQTNSRIEDFFALWGNVFRIMSFFSLVWGQSLLKSQQFAAEKYLTTMEIPAWTVLSLLWILA